MRDKRTRRQKLGLPRLEEVGPHIPNDEHHVGEYREWMKLWASRKFYWERPERIYLSACRYSNSGLIDGKVHLPEWWTAKNPYY